MNVNQLAHLIKIVKDEVDHFTSDNFNIGKDRTKVEKRLVKLTEELQELWDSYIDY